MNNRWITGFFFPQQSIIVIVHSLRLKLGELSRTAQLFYISKIIKQEWNEAGKDLKRNQV